MQKRININSTESEVLKTMMGLEILHSRVEID